MPIQTIISGRIETNTEEPVSNVKVEIRDRNQYGLVATTYTIPSGEFAFAIPEEIVNMINNEEVIPAYTVWLGDNMLHEEEIPLMPEGELVLQIEEWIYHDAQSNIEEQLDLGGQIIVTSGDPLDFSQIRVDLVDIGNNESQFVASTYVAADGQFSFVLWGEVAAEYASMQIQYKLWIAEYNLVNLAPGESHPEIEITSGQFDNGINSPEPIALLDISGNVSLNESGETLSNIGIVIEGSSISGIGRLNEIFSDPSGNFSGSFLNTTAIWLRSGVLKPTVNLYVGNTFLTSQVSAIGQTPLILKVDDEVYEEATGGGEPVYDPVFHGMVSELTDLSNQISTVFSSLSTAQDQLFRAEEELGLVKSYNLDSTDVLGRIGILSTDVTTLGGQYAILRGTHTTKLQQFYELYPSQIDHVRNLDDQYPVLFFPVRLETTFRIEGENHQLWVRIFPDDIAVDTHETKFTIPEIKAAKEYYAIFHKQNVTKADRLEAWNVISEAFTPERAAWILKIVVPSNTNPLQFSASWDTENPLNPNVKLDSWTKQPATRILPDAFILIGYANNNYASPVFYTQLKNIPDDLKIGIDPSKTNSLQQIGGDIAVDPSIEWMTNFDAAINVGLGKKILLNSSDYYNGFTRIIALGVKTSLTKEASQTRLEELIDNHHYTDGFSLIKQGTSTNNTDNEYSGYSSVDFGNETTFATEQEGKLFTPVWFNRDKTDGQLLCEALGIKFETLEHIYHSNGRDIIDAMKMNNSIFQVAVGSYLSNYWGVSTTQVDELRDFFAEYVRSRGALPSIRSGVQPYGILPTTVFSRMNWGQNPNAGLYRNIYEVVRVLDPTWTNLVTVDGATGVESGSQKITNILTKSAVSSSYKWRFGVGPAYIWNNLAYASSEGGTSPQNWLNAQLQRMSQMQQETGLPMNPMPRIAQMNYREDVADVTRPLVAEKWVDKSKPLPNIGESGINYMRLIAEATFTELRDENYERLGVAEDEIPNTLLYQLERQSLLLEYYDTGAKLLNVPDSERIDPELINILNQGDQVEIPAGDPNFKVYAGASKWTLFEEPFEGYDTLAAFFDSGDFVSMPQAVYLVRARDSIMDLSGNTVGELGLLASEAIDTTSFRIDTWSLSLVNRRLFSIRGIQDGSSNRTMGLYLGGYGWVEDVYPTAGSGNHGYIHAPSLSQAATAAVLRSGFMKYGANANSPLSVNISSQRVRGALQILNGIRNGQELSILLGYEFEKRLHDLYEPVPGRLTDRLIVPLRELYPLTNTISTVTPSGGKNDKARNVVNGTLLIERFKADASNQFDDEFNLLNQNLANQNPPANSVSISERTAVINEYLWIADLLDAVGDVTNVESVFQLVQGNPGRASAFSEAISRGAQLPEVEHIETPKTGTGVYQRFTMHFEQSTLPVEGWNYSEATSQFEHTRRSEAEPYINTWIGSLFADPSLVICNVKNATDNGAVYEVSLADLQIQPIDLVYLLQDEMENDDSEIALRIRKFARDSGWAIKGDSVEILYDVSSSSGKHSFIHVLPILRYVKLIVTKSRSLKTSDYVSPIEPQEITNIYNRSDYNARMLEAYNSLVTARANLVTADIDISNYSPVGADFNNLRDALFVISRFGIEQTIYEFVEQNIDEFKEMKAKAAYVLGEAQRRIKQYDVITFGINALDDDDFIAKGSNAIKAVFGKEFNTLPLFQLRQSDVNNIFSPQIAGTSTILNDHTNNPYVIDEWLSGIAKVRKNAANYEMLSILSSVINMDVFVEDRHIVPMQTPFDFASGSERWLGAKVNNAAGIKGGRVAFGVSLPKTGIPYDMSGYQVGIMIDDWVDVIPNRTETTGVAFHFNQPNAKPPQCLLLGLTPKIKGYWDWNDLVDMINETFDMAKKRGVTYNDLTTTAVAQFSPTIHIPISQTYSTIGFTLSSI